MTMLASWVGIDTHGIGSAYIVSESRFTWKQSRKIYTWDYGKKVFASCAYPEIFGYAGDVLFPTVILSQIIGLIDSEVIFNKNTSCEQKSQLVFDLLRSELTKYPINCINDSFQIIHISRDTIVNGYPDFHIYCYFWDKKNGWQKFEKPIPCESGLVYVLGSGREEFKNNYILKYQRGNNSDTSRNVFHCFVDTLSSINDLCCGGAPQLVGIYRKPNSSAKNFGVVYNDKRYFLGCEVPEDVCFENIEWRNELFELVSGKTKNIIEGAMRQPNALMNK